MALRSPQESVARPFWLPPFLKVSHIIPKDSKMNRICRDEQEGHSLPNCLLQLNPGVVIFEVRRSGDHVLAFGPTE